MSERALDRRTLLKVAVGTIVEGILIAACQPPTRKQEFKPSPATNLPTNNTERIIASTDQLSDFRIVIPDTARPDIGNVQILLRPGVFSDQPIIDQLLPPQEIDSPMRLSFLYELASGVLMIKAGLREGVNDAESIQQLKNYVIRQTRWIEIPRFRPEAGCLMQGSWDDNGYRLERAAAADTGNQYDILLAPRNQQQRPPNT